MAKLKDLGVGLVLLILFWMFSLMTISLNFKFHKNPSCLKVSRSLLKNYDTLLGFRRMWRFLTGAGVTDHIFICSFGVNKLKFQVS